MYDDDDDDYGYGTKQTSSSYVRTSASRKAIGCVGCLSRLLLFFFGVFALIFFVGMLKQPGKTDPTFTWTFGGIFLVSIILWWVSTRFFGEQARRQSVVDNERWHLEEKDKYDRDDVLRQKAQRAFAKRQARRKR